MEMCISIAFLYRMKAAYNHVTSPQKARRSTHAKEKGRESLRKIFVPPLFAPHLILVVEQRHKSFYFDTAFAIWHNFQNHILEAKHKLLHFIDPHFLTHKIKQEGLECLLYVS